MRWIVVAVAGIVAGAMLVGGARAAPGEGQACAAAVADPANKWRKPELRVVLTARDAIWYGRNDQLAALLDDCLAADARDPDGDPLLHMAADRGKADAVRILLAHGASRTLTDPRGKRADDLAGPNTRALFGPASPAAAQTGGRDKDCQAKYQADAALCSDSPAGCARCGNGAPASKPGAIGSGRRRSSWCLQLGPSL